MLVAVVAVVALAVVLTRPSGTDNAGGEVFLQPAAATGPDPFTESVATTQDTPPESPAASPTGPTGSKPPSSPAGTTTGTRSISGSAPGVYGGTRDTASCDVEKLIGSLSADPSKNAAFASAQGIQPQAVPAFLRSLTSVQLRMDTRVTNHGYQNGKLNAYQAVLQAGTAVLVDDRGVPRVRCACGNPLGPPVALKADPKRFGQTWSSYQPQKVVVIAPAPTVVHKIVIYDQHNRSWYERDKGSHHGKPDRPVPPPPIHTPTIIPTKPTGTRTAPTPTDTKTSPKPTDTKTSPTPTDTKTSPKPTDTKTSPTPTDTKTSPKPTDTKTTPTPTDTKTTPTPTESKPTPTPTPTETKTSATPTETETSATPTETKTSATPTEKETPTPATPTETHTTASAEITPETTPQTTPETTPETSTKPESAAPARPETPVAPTPVKPEQEQQQEQQQQEQQQEVPGNQSE
ncbi:DUF6777 domain-containing protein [Streptomyces sp. NPDC001586]|uniref:DUF6777 domain-containing protein n=1 Tax=Streptomyces sp. NPDC001586 TaxID=3154387 RepID=UPI003318F0A1